MILYTTFYQSPFGKLLIAVDEVSALVCLILPNGHEHWAAEIVKKDYTVIPDAERCQKVTMQLSEYFQQKRRTFDLPLRPIGTAFQQSVWTALRSISYGTTITYKELAEKIGNPAAIRAVGRANGSNPIPIIVPCHRVIGADGSLIGFGGGVPLKKSLLELEGVPVAQVGKTHQLSLL